MFLNTVAGTKPPNYKTTLRSRAIELQDHITIKCSSDYITTELHYYITIKCGSDYTTTEPQDYTATLLPLLPPSLPVQTPEVDRFREVVRLNLGDAFQVRNRSGDLQDAVVGAGA